MDRVFSLRATMNLNFRHSMIRVLCFFIILICPPLYAATNQHISVEQFLKNQKFIRVITDAGPGFGNQANSANMVAWLKQKGFKGTIEFIYPDIVSEKVSLLFDLPAVLPDVYVYKYDANIDIQFIKLREHIKRLRNKALTQMDLGISGAFDFSPCEIADWDHIDVKDLTKIQCNNFANFTGVKAFSQLNPYLGKDSRVTNLYQLDQSVPLKLDNQKTFLTMPVASYNQAVNYLNNDPRGKKLLMQKKGLKALLTGMDKQDFNVMFVYGWLIKLYDKKDPEYREGFFPGNFFQILTAARYAQLNGGSDFHKPLIIVVLYDYQKELNEISKLIKSDNWGDYELPGANEARQVIKKLDLTNTVSVVDLADAQAIQKIQNLTANKILIVSTGPLPKIVFDGLYNHTSTNIWPEIREGANSFNSLILTESPHLRCMWDWELDLDDVQDLSFKNRLQKIYPGDEGMEQGFCAGMKTWVNNIDISSLVGELIIDSKSNHSAFSDYFKELKTKAIQPANDRVYISLEEVIKRVN